ncbi:hypothetical protein DSO57_1019023 [Entomophthora muscae]|uniref:Uncharacterized protein n=1 Tax=Entomophthora muscae TaxID=34485 RepID=A0ACC2TRL5_9FUNG|nr:hypothetical protein DSO57_1019023 [Entomophthora muscae]
MTHMEDCDLDVKIPSQNVLVLDAYNVANASINFKLPPFIPNIQCQGSETRIFAPGYKKDNVKLYNIYLLIKLEETIRSNNSVISTKNYTVKPQERLQDDRCNSFVTHKYTSSPNDF